MSIQEIESAWDAIRTRMEAVRPHLEKRGFLTPKSRDSANWVIRYRDPGPDRTRLRSLAVGSNPDLVERARRLLAEWQAVRHPERSLNNCARETWTALHQSAKAMPRRKRELFLKALRPVGTDPLQLFKAVNEWPNTLNEYRRNNPPGRPRRSARLFRFEPQSRSHCREPQVGERLARVFDFSFNQRQKVTYGSLD